MESPVGRRAGGRIPFRGRGAPCRRARKSTFCRLTVSKEGSRHEIIEVQFHCPSFRAFRARQSLRDETAPHPAEETAC